MRLCFIEPRGIHRGLNTGLGYLCGRLQGDSKVFDFNNKPDNIEERLEEISGHDVVGFSLKSLNVRDSGAMAKRVKTPQNVLIAGGVHIGVDGRNFLKDHPQFDIAVAGEGELVITEIISHLATGRPRLDAIPGVYYRQNGRVAYSGASRRVTDLASLPFPDYSRFDSVDGPISNYPLVTSRGCPYSCTYCCVRDVMGRKWFAKAPEAILDELRHAMSAYGITRFNIQDDDFTLDMNRAKRFCRLLIEADLKLVWSCPNGIRADRVDRELLELMKQAGCFALSVGIESGDPHEFGAIKKGETLDQIASMVRTAREVGMDVYGNFIVGLPHSTLASTRRTVQFARGLKLDSSIFNLLIPFPGTAIWEWVSAHGRRLTDWREGFMVSTDPRPVFDTEDFPREERIRAYTEANIALRNYFAFIHEQEGLLRNVLRVLSVILRYDARHVLGHAWWVVRNSWRVWERILHKNR